MAEVTPVLFKKRVFKAPSARKRPATPPDQSSGSEYSSEDESGIRVKRRKRGGLVATAVAYKPAEELSKSIAFVGDRTAAISNEDDATRTSNWYDADAADPSKQRKPKDDAPGPATSGYKGAANYTDFIPKHPDAPQRSLGPMKGPTNVRTMTITDYAPDVCKDYKQTGFCGFGDSCKFLHAREDYKQGWQLDRDWEKVQKNPSAKTAADTAKDDEGLLKDIPFACIICKQSYRTPTIVTRCGHYFCQDCAMARYRSKGGKTCAACKADTGGNFNIARNLNRLLDKKRERIKARKEQDRAEGLQVSSGEEG